MYAAEFSAAVTKEQKKKYRHVVYWRCMVWHVTWTKPLMDIGEKYIKNKQKRGSKEKKRAGIFQVLLLLGVQVCCVHGILLPDLSSILGDVLLETRSSARFSDLFLQVIGEKGRFSSQSRVLMSPEWRAGWWRTVRMVVSSSNVLRPLDARESCLPA